MPCAPGTNYFMDTCSCSTFAKPVSYQPQKPDCRPLLYLPFDSDVRDHSGNYNYVQNDGVTIHNGAAYFNGHTGLRIPRFANMDFGSQLMIKFRYKKETQITRKQAVISNGDCSTSGSLYIIAADKFTSFGIKTISHRAAAVTVPSEDTEWRDTMFYLDGNLLSGSVNGDSSQTLAGPIQRKNCAIQIGRGTGFGNFKGYIDDLKIYLCKPNKK
ncbi:hypothetical protein LOTGIDRAFT_237510 [Lottia gigantea]|uniref:Laminin G domain-containing protein n=1 Tax=Lottia gigantea TaxID=225164 RepID=V4AIZ6_LOTGI|nr:hypothetical protein LOTGIDRAFT_237510 [Lottia gigantea]ESP04114.1 hypothetical protein LOTGIDRAFT_237510 [Lottia gigantea]